MYTAVILARGGSKGIPKKNLTELNGCPLIYWSILFARRSEHISEIIVSSDSDEILEYADKVGVSEVIRRPSELAQDHSTDLESFLHLLSTSKKMKKCEYVVQLRPTNPFRKLSWMHRVDQMIKAKPELTSIRSIEQATENPFKMWFLKNNGQIKNVIEVSKIQNHHSAPRQVLPISYKQNAHLDIIKRQTIEDGQIIGNMPCGLVVEPKLPDIDTWNDLKISRESFHDLIDPEFFEP
jgi:CMP-N,N'-diacetyllegionaminic acid synthase